MSVREHIGSLEELSVLDQEIRAIDEQLSQDREAVAELKQQLKVLEQGIATDAASIAEMAKARMDLIQETRQVASQVERSREKLARARNEREQNAATRELEELRRIQKEREEEAGKLQMLESQAQKSKDEAELAQMEVLEKLNSTEGEAAETISQVEAKHQQKLEARKNLARSLPRNLLSRYDMIRRKRGAAIALTQDGTCQACHMAVPPQLFQKILRGENLEQCPSCQRILYYKPPESTDDET